MPLNALMPLSNGAIFAGFTIVRRLGSGGMGEVYLVQHPRLPRRNALKILSADLSADPEYRARFNREADLASTLYHPHIVGVHDRGEYNGQLWLLMDFVDGQDAACLLADRYPAGMPLDMVLSIITGVASALDYAHKQGLLHRDVKPANIMLTHVVDDGEQRILLTDFGIARTVDDVSGLTTTNMTVGTVAYSAPEQLMGEEIDGRADQYALAAAAYHLLTGLQLFPHSNPAVVISRHLNVAPPVLADTRPELAALDPVLAAALAKNPDQRFARCSDFARAVADQASPTGVAIPIAPTASAPLPLAGTAVAGERVPAPPPQQPAPSASPPSAGLTRLDSPIAPRPTWQRPGVIVAALVAVVLVAGLVTISIVITRSDSNTSATTTTGELTTPAQADTSGASPSRSSTLPTKSVTASTGSNPTIVDYIKQNNIVETSVHRGDRGSPTINLPFPPGWEDAGNRTPAWAYDAIVSSDPAMAQDPPTVVALVSKLTGNVDPAKILEFAPGEIKNLPGYNGATEATPSTLGGFDATQIGGTYTKDGVKRAVAQKTVVIPGKNALFVLQLNADGTEDQMGALMDATGVIDEQTTITP
jgi:serine/threonine-protein kinase